MTNHYGRSGLLQALNDFIWFRWKRRHLRQAVRHRLQPDLQPFASVNRRPFALIRQNPRATLESSTNKKPNGIICNTLKWLENQVEQPALD